MFVLSDVFIGTFPATQYFGVNPDRYKQFGLKGHNGMDFGCRMGTQIVATADGVVIETGFDSAGYGNYLKISHPGGYLTLYGHLSQILVKVSDHVVAGQLIGLSGNTGNSTAPHLHFGVAPCDQKGIKTEVGNGYSGYIDPLSSKCVWQLKNLASPVSPPQPKPAPGANGDELRALTVLYQAFQNLRTFDGSSFGNLEGLTRELVDAYPKYQELIKKPLS